MLVTALRYRIVQAGAGTIVLAFLLSQLAVVALAWGRASRLAGLAELVREGVKAPAARPPSAEPIPAPSP